MGQHPSAPIPGGLTVVSDHNSFCWPGHGYKCPDTAGFGGVPSKKHTYEQYNENVLICQYYSRGEAAESAYYTAAYNPDGSWAKGWSVGLDSVTPTPPQRDTVIGTFPDMAQCCGSDCDINQHHTSPTLQNGGPGQCPISQTTVPSLAAIQGVQQGGIGAH
ncbi:hypothetical protein FRB96_004009 [Tulasnella sp. 330]|nr:hypothetical protein FRB96_004009 [Tulasnella sp. 330]KAG8872740.1 hypothetical protein FRB97_007394 [Tulasnella sp. 331]KAG8880552.1 hypothetical protein FRB98_005008 [Tulasnella sp. 332]